MSSNLMSVSIGSYVRITAGDKYFSCPHPLKPLYSLSIGIQLMLSETRGLAGVEGAGEMGEKGSKGIDFQL